MYTETNCPTLRPPKNGALACSTWANGPACQIHCNANYDLPVWDTIKTSGLVIGLFVCSTTNGIWQGLPPDNTPHDCSGLSIYLGLHILSKNLH